MNTRSIGEYLLQGSCKKPIRNRSDDSEVIHCAKYIYLVHEYRIIAAYADFGDCTLDRPLRPEVGNYTQFWRECSGRARMI